VPYSMVFAGPPGNGRMYFQGGGGSSRSDVEVDFLHDDAGGFLTTLASSPGITPWQVEQATDALTILPGNAFGQGTDGGKPAAM
jgi:hypothetical protein